MPTNKMERFTKRARRVMSLAQEEAERLKHNYIGTEHLLLGMMREEGGVASRVLHDLGLEQNKVEEAVNKFTRTTPRLPNTTLDLAPGTKRVLELAVDEARRMGHHYIGTEHLLLGLVRQSVGVAIDVLKYFKLSDEEVRHRTRQIMQEMPVGKKTGTQQPSTSSLPQFTYEPTEPNGSSIHDFRLVIKDKSTDIVKADVNFPADNAQAVKECFDLILTMVQQNRAGRFTFDVGDYTIQVDLLYGDERKDKESPPPSC